MAVLGGPIVFNVALSTAAAPLTDGDPDYTNTHGICVRNGPIGATPNTINVGIALSSSPSEYFWLAPGDAYTFQPADAATTADILMIAASGTPSVMVVVSG